MMDRIRDLVDGVLLSISADSIDILMDTAPATPGTSIELTSPLDRYMATSTASPGSLSRHESRGGSHPQTPFASSPLVSSLPPVRLPWSELMYMLNRMGDRQVRLRFQSSHFLTVILSMCFTYTFHFLTAPSPPILFRQPHCFKTITSFTRPLTHSLSILHAPHRS